MDQAEYARRLKKLIIQENANPDRYVFLSFASAEGFGGGCIVKARGPVTARIRAMRAGLRPQGCQTYATELNDQSVPGVEYHNRLLSLEECHAIFPGSSLVRDMTDDEIKNSKPC